jgi:cytochrome c biogenesis protein CcmG, thiol:disulfide interchange protein DsbE
MIRVLAVDGAWKAKSRSSFARTDSRGRLSPHGLFLHLSRGRFAKTAAVCLLAGALLLVMCGCYSGSRPARIGTAAPDFTVRDSDRSVTLSQFKGQVVVLNFWATWCPPCIEEMPSLVQMQQRMKAKGVTVLAVSVDVDQSNYQRFLRDHNVDLLAVRDADQKSNTLYGTFKFPETYVIDRNGIMRRKFIGAVDWTEPDVIEYLGKL